MLELPLPSELSYWVELKVAGTGSSGCTGSQRLPLLRFALVVCLAPAQLSHLGVTSATGDADEPTGLWPYKAEGQRASPPLCDGYWGIL